MLDEVTGWDDEQIQCRSTQFASDHNPLFEGGRLETVLLIEYAAQAAAIHAALLQSELGKPRPAYIGAVKNIELLQAVDNTLAIEISAHCLLNNSSGAIYEFVATQDNCALIKGRLILNQP
jgi:predicted hotdog family 3-hydroxylacyl-ACP dehydratase